MKVEISIKLEKIDDKILGIGDIEHIIFRPISACRVELELPDGKRVVLDINELRKAVNLLSTV